MTHIYDVHEVNEYLDEVVASDPFFSQMTVRGEISNWTKAASGHCYFTLKDALSEIRCVMWRSAAQMLPVLPRNGDAVLVTGNLSVYVERGQYQLYADRIQPVGVGELFRRFEALKAMLNAAGLFDEARKKALPAFPKRIGIVTSPTTAALQDILNVLRRRQPMAQVVLSPTAVQGVEAPGGIVHALTRLQQAQVDVIIMARGGGSIEDLWAFNEEIVARAMFDCAIPIITGVGHEIDFTIADFVADHRAPTPSAAAEVAVPDIREVRDRLEEYRYALDVALDSTLDAYRETQVRGERRLARLVPIQRIHAARQRVDEWEERLSRRLTAQIALQRSQLQGAQGRLASLNPAATLARGYAIVSLPESGRVITSAADIAVGAEVSIQFGDGGADAKITRKA